MVSNVTWVAPQAAPHHHEYNSYDQQPQQYQEPEQHQHSYSQISYEGYGHH